MTDHDDTAMKPCCGPSSGPRAVPRHVQDLAGQRNTAGSVEIPGGMGLLGTDAPQIPDDGENPLRRKRVNPFRIGAHAVTNAEFLAFVEATGFVTEAESFGWSFVFWLDVPKELGATEGVSGVEWWRKVDGATWRDVQGPGSEARAWHADHPAVHISWNDARAYAQWVGGRLPTEAEWEHAARGGQADVRFPWGDVEPNDTDTFPCNIWQGDFPQSNTAADGWATTAPVQSYKPNAFGLWNMVGNVWEWTADPYRVKSLKKTVRQRLQSMPGYKVLKGGSFLCHRSYCYRYRIAARSGTSPDSATTHHGFRAVWPE